MLRENHLFTFHVDPANGQTPTDRGKSTGNNKLCSCNAMVTCEIKLF